MFLEVCGGGVVEEGEDVAFERGDVRDVAG